MWNSQSLQMDSEREIWVLNVPATFWAFLEKLNRLSETDATSLLPPKTSGLSLFVQFLRWMEKNIPTARNSHFPSFLKGSGRIHPGLSFVFDDSLAVLFCSQSPLCWLTWLIRLHYNPKSFFKQWREFKKLIPMEPSDFFLTEKPITLILLF